MILRFESKDSYPEQDPDKVRDIFERWIQDYKNQNEQVGFYRVTDSTLEIVKP